MVKLKKCAGCGSYSLGEKCKCGGNTVDAHYRFIKVRDAPRDSDDYWKKRNAI